MTQETFKLDELARRAGTTPRTVRYYVQRGLLPAPAFHGKDTAYGPEHLVRLRAIRRLQERFLPLDAIQVELASRSLDELARIADGTDEASHGASHGTHAAAPAHSPPSSHPSPHPGRGPFRHPSTRAIAGHAWRRFVLAPGIELHVEEGADESTRALSEALLSFVEEAKKS